MDANIYDLIKETTSTTGTVLNVTLTAVTGFGRFSDAAIPGEPVYYAIRNGDNSELGIGTVKTGNTIDRTTPLVTLVAGVYDSTAPTRISLLGASEVAIAPSAKALMDAANTLPLGGNSSKNFVATGTIASAGLSVALNVDGTVSVVGLSGAASVGTSTVFESANAIYLSAVYVPTDNKVVVVYTDGGNSNYGTAIVGTVSGTTISFGTAVVFNNADTSFYNSVTYDSTNNKVVIAYRNLGNLNYGTAIVGTVSGTTISFGTAVVFNSATTAYNLAVYDSTNNKVVISYQNAGNSNYGTAIVGTVSGTTISFGTAVVFESANSSHISGVYDPTNNKVVISYRDAGNLNYGTAIVGTVSGTTISFGTAVVFNSATTVYTSAVYDSTSSQIVIAYQNGGNTNYGTAIVGTVSNTTISFGTAVVFESATTNVVSATFNSIADQVIITYQDAGNTNFGTVIAGTVTGTTISFGPAMVFNSANSYSIYAVYNSTDNKVVIAYNNAGNLNYGTAIVYQSNTSNSASVIGIAQTPAVDAAVSVIGVKGFIDANQVGLTVGSKYYVTTAGTLTTASTNTRYVGKALSATELYIDAI